jgi:hypothetical protein
MANLGNFDASQVDPASSFDPIPAGKYLATITESETKPTKNGSGSYLQLTFRILDGPYKGLYLRSLPNAEHQRRANSPSDGLTWRNIH